MQYMVSPKTHFTWQQWTQLVVHKAVKAYVTSEKLSTFPPQFQVHKTVPLKPKQDSVGITCVPLNRKTH